MSQVICATTRVGVLAAVLTLLAGCSGKGEDTAEAAPAVDPVAVAKAADTDSNLVSAVSIGKPGAPVTMKFELAAKPKVGEPLTIQVQLSTDAPGITGLQVVFQSNADLQVKSGGELSLMSAVQPGQPIDHQVVVTPLRDGIFYLSAVAVAEGAGSQARTFSIPVVVGDSTVLEAGKAGAAPVDAKGERVTSLSASESGSRP
jgi:hypothetical protein